MNRSRREDRLANEVLGRLAGCREAEDLLRYHEGSIPAPERVLLEDHLSRCGACAAAVAHLAAAEESSLGETPIPKEVEARSEDLIARFDGSHDDLGTSRSYPRPRSWALAIGAVAATLLIVVAIEVREPSPKPVYREGSDVTIHTLLPEGQSLPRGNCVLRWSPGPAGSRYNVTVVTEQLELLARQHGLEAEEWRVPEDALAKLSPGAKLLWQVEVLLPDGSRVSSVTFVTSIH